MICNNCKAEIADNAKLCPLCNVVPVIMFGKPKNTGPSPAAPSKSGAFIGWIVLAVVVAAAGYSYLHPETTASLFGSSQKIMDGKLPNGPDSIRIAHAATDR